MATFSFVADASEREAVRKAIYSGSNRSGICVCGHRWDEHHLGVVARSEATEPDGGPEGYIPQECEHFEFDEIGGLDDEGNPHFDEWARCLVVATDQKVRVKTWLTGKRNDRYGKMSAALMLRISPAGPT